MLRSSLSLLALSLASLASLATVTALGAIATSAHAQEMRLISGAVAYRERMALPPQAELIVGAAGLFGVELGEVRQSADGKQVPWPFTVEVPAGLAATLSPTIAVDGQVLWRADPIRVQAGVSDADLGTIMLTAPDPEAARVPYTCGDLHMSVAFGDEEAVLYLDDETITLPQAMSASGARYADADERTVFWIKGDRGTLTLDGREVPECIADETDQGATWTGQGNEPGWRAVIDAGRLALDLDYGENSLDLSLPEPTVEAGAYRFQLPDFAIELTVEDTLCADDMSGRPYPQTVRLTLPTRTLSGCGGDTLALLAGPQWSVGEIGGAAVPPAGAITMGFSVDGRISGSAGCNQFFGPIAIDGEGGLTVGPLVSTKMACPQMDLEQAFLEALSAADRFDFAENGELELFAGGEAVVKASR